MPKCNFAGIKNNCYLCSANFDKVIVLGSLTQRLKGNQVKILDSPAAVSSR